MKRFWCVYIFLLLSPRTIQAQVGLPNTMTAQYTDADIRLDGRLNEAIWDSVQRITNFTQRELFENAPATERTEVAIIYNDKFLYIGVWCYDSNPKKIVAKEFRRDFNRALEDNFQIVIDTYGDNRNGFLFAVNPNAARADLQVFDNGKSTNAFWNGVWDARTQITSEGWFAEIEIPFSTLKYQTGEAGELRAWGINFERNIQSKREQVLWQGWSRDASLLWVNRAGTLLGLENITNKQFVELKPYGIAGAESRSGEPDAVANVGGDLNYLISPTYRLNLTLNTDFAQVESDQQQINLTRFPLFFPELREFFLEGEDFFDMGFGGNRIIPFYSRRIGLDDNRAPVPIIGGARLLGKEGNRTLGVMSIQAAGTETESPTNYSVMSWRQDVGQQSTIGVMSVNKITQDRFHTTTGVNFRYSTSKIFGNKNLNTGGAFITTQNSGQQLERDAYAYRLFLQYPNDQINIFMSAQKSPIPFDPEVGLMRRRNFEEFFATAGWRPRPKADSWWKWIRQWDINPGEFTYTIYNDTRQLQSFLWTVRPLGFSTRSGEYFAAQIERSAEGLIEDFNIRGDEVVIPSGEYWFTRYSINGNTFASRFISGRFRISTGQFFDGARTEQFYETRIRASKYLSISAVVEQNDVQLPQGNFTTTLFGNRLEYAFNPNLFGLLFTQWNNDQELLIVNYRLQWIPIIGADFFLIVNHVVKTNNEIWVPQQTAIIGKLIWRFVI